MTTLLLLLWTVASAFVVTTTPRPKTTRLRAQKEAVVGLGCFWEPSEELLKVDGIIETRVGYAGGPKNMKPNYESVCAGDGNVEAVQIFYDDEKLSYEAVLDAARTTAKPGPKRQYNAVVFTRNDDQFQRATKWTKNDFTVEGIETFWIAETYHQEYWQKNRPRFVAFAILFALQVVVPNFAAQYNDAITLVVLAGALVVVAERFILPGVTESSSA